MDAAREILNIISPWVATGRITRSVDVSFIDEKDIATLRRYARAMTALGGGYRSLCNEAEYHRALRVLIQPSDYFRVFTVSASDWNSLDTLLSGLVGVLLQQSGSWLSSGREISTLVDTMEVMEQLEATVGSLTEGKLRELHRRSLSPHDLQAVGALRAILARTLEEVKVNQALVMMANKGAAHFSRDYRAVVSPALERLQKATVAEQCRTQPCHAHLSGAQSLLNNVIHHERVDASATALNDLQVTLSTYLTSSICDLASLHDNLDMLGFAVRFHGVLDAWQTVDDLLRGAGRALQ
ncbi:hypothetical protein [Pseudomonas putida]